MIMFRHCCFAVVRGDGGNQYFFVAFTVVVYDTKRRNFISEGDTNHHHPNKCMCTDRFGRGHLVLTEKWWASNALLCLPCARCIVDIFAPPRIPSCSRPTPIVLLKRLSVCFCKTAMPLMLLMVQWMNGLAVLILLCLPKYCR